VILERDFTLDALLPDRKAVADDGSIIIEGYASDIGLDRQDEMFEDGAFTKAIEKFLSTNPVLLYHHDAGKALGRVLELEPHPGKGLWMKAVIDPPAQGSWAEDVFEKVKRGTIKGLSVGGRFFRPTKGRISRADLMEISVTPLPVNPRTLFAVAQKAFGDNAIEAVARKHLDEMVSQISESLFLLDQATKSLAPKQDSTEPTVL
jgi:HK97 family phage prohead protease